MPVKATTPAVQLDQVIASTAPPVERRLHETSRDAAVATLEALGYKYLGKARWSPPIASPAIQPPQAKEQGPLLSDSYMDVMDVTAMLELETMTPIDGLDEI